jgi:hypothetical protein
MKKRISRISLILLAGLLVLCAVLAGCTNSQDLDEIEARAAEYVQTKYGESFSLLSGSQLTQQVQRWVPHSSGDCLLVFRDGDGSFRVWYDAERDLFLDDRQAEEINARIREELLEPLRAQLMPCEWAVEDSAAGSVDDLLLNLDGCFFHTRYEGDIVAFCREEKPPLTVELVLFTETEDRAEWEARLQLFADAFDEYFSLPQYFWAGERLGYPVYVKVHREAEWRAHPRCHFLAQLTIDAEGTQLYTPSWIELLTGIYVTAADDSRQIELLPGDLALERACSAEEFAGILADYPDSEGKPRELPICSDVYVIRFSDRLSEQLHGEPLYVLIETDADAPYEDLSLYMITLNPEKKTSFTRFVTRPGWQMDIILYDGPADGTLFYFFWLKDQ